MALISDLKLTPFRKMFDRVAMAKEESDTEYFLSLMYAGEQLTKFIALSLVSGIQDDVNRSRYTQLYNLVRADGIGDWVRCIDEVVQGPTSHLCSIEIKKICKDLVQKTPKHNWQFDSVSLIHSCLKAIGETTEELPTKIQAKNWFQSFSRLRNKTRGHGATRSEIMNSICPQLEKSIKLIISNFSLFNCEWAFLFQNLSGKYRVSPISDNPSSFNYLKSNEGKKEHYSTGVYLYLNRPILVNLIDSDVELADFFFPNGGFSSKRYETLSYITGNKDSKDNSNFLVPSGNLPSSETEGSKALDIVGNCFTNLPIFESLYIPREILETQLYNVLVDDRHPVVTLVGRGGIGKTSLALRVLKMLCNAERFQTILWFSARDIDLLEEGAKSVKPSVIKIEDLSLEFKNLLQPKGYLDKEFNDKMYVENQLSKCDLGPLLIVLDNFETVQNPEEMFAWLDTFIRLPNKILITSRFRDFKADYPISVGGLTRPEFDILVNKISNELGIFDLLSGEYHSDLFYETGGHPYVTKILLGEVAKERRLGDMRRIVSGNEDLLTALFERTFAIISPAAKRVFLTLCSWRSSIPAVGVEAVLRARSVESFDVEEAIEELYSFSLVDKIKSKTDSLSLLFVPLSAFLFGKKKLSVSPNKSLIDQDLRILMLFGVSNINQPQDVSSRIDVFFRQVANGIATQKMKLEDFDGVLRQLCLRHNESWLSLATLYEENDMVDNQVDCYQSYLESAADSSRKISIWKKLASIYYKSGQLYEEANALVQMCAIQATTFSLVSSSMKRINQIIASEKLESDQEKTAIISRMISIINERRDAGASMDNDDLSALAWLHIHLRNIREAKKIVKKVLEVDPKHYHSLNIAKKLHMNEQL